MIRPHWIKTSTAKGHKFQCSSCKGECVCITIGNASKYKAYNKCDYRFCPRCGKEMELEESTVFVKMEKNMRDCEHCKHYTWDLDRKYKSCECWECEFEKEDCHEKKTDILQKMANRNN